MRTREIQKSLEEEILNCKKRLKELAPYIETDEDKSNEIKSHNNIELKDWVKTSGRIEGRRCFAINK